MIPGEKRELGACYLEGKNSGKLAVGSTADTEAAPRAKMLIQVVENGLLHSSA
jgi:hypothetical protein